MAETAARPAIPAPDISGLRLTALIAALTAYGIGGSPTPDAIGGAEIFTGLALVFAAGGWRAARIFNGFETGAGWEKAGFALFLYGITVPLIAGVACGNSAGGIARDLLFFIFLLLPLFLMGLCAYRRSYLVPVTVAVAGAGLLFSARVLAPVFAGVAGPVWYLRPPADPFYLANAPTVIFAFLLLAGTAGKRIYDLPGLREVAAAGLLAALSFFPLAAMALITQRASMGVIVLSAVFLSLIALWRNPRRAVLPLAVLALAAWAGWDAVNFIGGEAARKTAAVGLNMRWAEAAAVMDSMTGSPWAVLFGRGWGATVASPAVGGMTVNFTHSLLTTAFLKTGACGLALILFYVFHIIKLLWRLLWVNPVMAFALAGPLVIDTLLYASFKSLDFGLILLLAVLWGTAAKVASGACRS